MESLELEVCSWLFNVCCQRYLRVEIRICFQIHFEILVCGTLNSAILESNIVCKKTLLCHTKGQCRQNVRHNFRSKSALTSKKIVKCDAQLTNRAKQRRKTFFTLCLKMFLKKSSRQKFPFFNILKIRKILIFNQDVFIKQQTFTKSTI